MVAVAVAILRILLILTYLAGALWAMPYLAAFDHSRLTRHGPGTGVNAPDATVKPPPVP